MTFPRTLGEDVAEIVSTWNRRVGKNVFKQKEKETERDESEGEGFKRGRG